MYVQNCTITGSSNKMIQHIFPFGKFYDFRKKPAFLGWLFSIVKNNSYCNVQECKKQLSGNDTAYAFQVYTSPGDFRAKGRISSAIFSSRL